ncbi:MAG: UDP-N-acetylmuramoyl-L-alanine--D-glutamate ligase [Pseudonocardiaceae bacterium]
MRPQISWSDLRGRAVGIYGLGCEGEANLRAALALGLDPILVDDVATRAEINGRPVLSTVPHGLAALLKCDVVIKTPGVSRYGRMVRLLGEAGVPVVGGVGLWLQEADRSKVLCITGTKGKSTTTAIVGHLLAGLGYRCLIGGNIGLPPQDPLAQGDFDYWAIEVSSYQAMDLACSPPVVAVTSLHPDHLPWHDGNPETYFRDKLSAASQPGAHITVVNGDSALLRSRRELLGPRVHWVHSDDDPSADWMLPLGVPGSHNRRNALIVRESLRAMGLPEADDETRMKTAAEGFVGLDSRLCTIGTAGGVTFVDDSLSTNVLPTIAAVEAFPNRRIALIVGGQSRGIDYQPLGVGLRARAVELLLISVPDNGPEIRCEVESAGPGKHVSAVDATDLRDAVRRGYDWARPDGVVLMSPAAPSFGRFRDYRERAAEFAAAMTIAIADGDHRR